jgi:hypothetical protein
MLLRRRITYGNLAEFNVLDTRQYRDDQAAGGGVDPPNPEQKDPSRSITGEAQERWLFEGLRRSRSRWNVLAQQVFFAQRDLRSGPGESFAMDAWDGYLGSRNRILDFIAERRIANPMVITGDVHNNWAADLKADFNDPNSPTVGTEFVGTSITSGGDGADTNPRAQGIIAENPHLKFFNGQRGYIRCVLTPESFRADYRVLPFVSRRGAPIHTRASFEVADGQPGAQQVGGEPIPAPPLWTGFRPRSSWTPRGSRLKKGPTVSLEAAGSWYGWYWHASARFAATKVFWAALRSTSHSFDLHTASLVVVARGSFALAHATPQAARDDQPHQPIPASSSRARPTLNRHVVDRGAWPLLAFTVPQGARVHRREADLPYQP